MIPLWTIPILWAVIAALILLVAQWVEGKMR